MLANMSAKQFGEWMGFILAEQELKEEARQQAEMEREALTGAAEIRARVRG
jgi:hypothetical protein